MATGGASLRKVSDLVHDYSCSKCEEFDLNIEANHFCPECEHYLCDTCVKLHNGYHRKHTVYGRGDIEKWEGFTIDICDQHGNKLEVHCDDHQELCCHVCVALNHRQCISISHLPDLARDFLKTEEFKRLPATVYQMMSRLVDLKNSMKDQASLRITYMNIMAEIKALRKEINNILDQLEKKTVELLNSMIMDLDASVKVDMEECADMHDQLKTMIEKVQQMTGKHKETSSYIGYIRLQNKLSKAKDQMKKLQNKPENIIRFKPDISLQKILRGLQVLGTIQWSEKAHIYNYLCSNAFKVGMETDEESYAIVGLWELPSGDLVIADKTNNRVKLLNRKYVVTSSCDMPASPEDLCHTSGNEVAIAFNDSDRHGVQFINVTRGKLQKVRMFTTDHLCTCIAYHKGQLYTSSGNTLYQYNIDGKVIKKIYEDKSCALTVRKCVVSPDGERFYVTNYWKNKLTILDKSGKVLSLLEDSELKYPSGLCVIPNGNVFVCGVGSDNVLQVDMEGPKKLVTVAGNVEWVSKPLSLCYSERTSSLLVGNDYITSLCIYS